MKVFNEADDKTADVATLDKDLLVFRLASVPGLGAGRVPVGHRQGLAGLGAGQVRGRQGRLQGRARRGRRQAKQAVVKSPAASRSAKAGAKTAASAKPHEAAC